MDNRTQTVDAKTWSFISSKLPNGTLLRGILQRGETLRKIDHKDERHMSAFGQESLAKSIHNESKCRISADEHQRLCQLDYDVETARMKNEKGETPDPQNLVAGHNRCVPIFIKFVDLKLNVILHPQPHWKMQDAIEKEILRGVTGSVAPGELLALMGPSGSGKTTVLNLLGGRVPRHKSYKLSGRITYNNLSYKKNLRRRIGFVTQDDILFPHLTVRETFKYASLLRLPKSFSIREKLKRAEEIRQQLGLERCKDTIIGDNFSRGISGGERKRVCIGLEILIDPSVMLLDEPTSGLDSTTALRIVLLFRKMVEEGRTIVMTVHQPSSRLFHRFDKVILLSEGHSIYFGKGKDAMNYFGSLGFCPLIAMNPADLLLDLCNGITDDMSIPNTLQSNCKQLMAKENAAEESAAARKVMQYLEDSCKLWITAEGKTIIMDSLQTELPEKRDWSTTWWQQFVVLLIRGVKEHRHEYVSRLRILQVVAISLISGCIWWQSNIDTLRGLQDQLGLIFYLTTFWGFIPLYTAVFVFPLERGILAKERASDVYRLSAYFMARSLGDMPLELVLPTVSLVIIYFMTHLYMTVVAFSLSLLSLYLMVLTSQGLGLFAGAALMDVQQGTTFASVSMTAVMLTGGFFLQHIPAFIKWLRYLSFQYYAYQLLIKVQYPPDRVYNCASSVGCKGVTSAEALRGMKLGGGGKEAVALVTMVVVYRVLAYFALRRMRM